MTHTGTIVGSGAKDALYPTYVAKFRETKTMWISEHGLKWRKRDGYQPGVQYPRQHLDLASIKPI